MKAQSVMVAGITVLSAFVYGCGGGAGNGSPPSSSGGAVFSYETAPPAGDASSFVQQVDGEGARGYRFVGNFLFSDGYALLFEKGSPTARYSHEMLSSASDAIGFQAQVNLAGSSGYRFVTNYTFDTVGGYTFYQKDTAGNSSYAYSLVPLASDTTSFSAQIGGEGKNGFRFVGNYHFPDGVYSLFERDTSSMTTYAYLLEPMVNEVAAFATQVNQDGAKGFRVVGNYVLTDGSSFTIYEKNSSASAAYTYDISTLTSQSSSFFRDQLNTKGAKGYCFLANYVFSTGGGSGNYLICQK